MHRFSNLVPVALCNNSVTSLGTSQVSFVVPALLDLGRVSVQVVLHLIHVEENLFPALFTIMIHLLDDVIFLEVTVQLSVLLDVHLMSLAVESHVRHRNWIKANATDNLNNVFRVIAEHFFFFVEHFQLLLLQMRLHYFCD